MIKPEVYQVSQKIVVAGCHVEYYKYEKPYYVGFPRLFTMGKKFRKPNKDQELIRADNVRRARQKIRRLINSNPDMLKFMTLTFDKNKVSINTTDLAETNKLFNLFIKRLTRIYPDLKYIAVPEFQKKSKQVHYHLLTNIKPYISNDDLANNVWQYGFAWLRKTYNIDNLGAYICKYLSKEIFDKRYFKKKKYFYSVNLLKPVIIDYLIEVKDFIKNTGLFNIKPLFSFNVLTEYLGEVYYYRYRVDNLKVAT